MFSLWYSNAIKRYRCGSLFTIPNRFVEQFATIYLCILKYRTNETKKTVVIETISKLKLWREIVPAYSMGL